MRTITRIFTFALLTLFAFSVDAARVQETEIAEQVIPPYSLGAKTEIDGVWELLNGSGLRDGYVIESEAVLPLPGFSGAPLNLLVMMNLQGEIIEVRLLNHNEPIFVSGLGEAPLNAFLEQYRGQSITASMVVGTKYGTAESGSALVYLDGVTKATASVRIAHETIIGAAREVAKQKLQGIVQAGMTATPRLDYEEELNWKLLVEEGLAKHIVVTNAEIDDKFAGTLWADDDPEAKAAPDENYLDFWLVDITPPAIAKAVLGEDSLEDIAALRAVSPDDELFLVIESARHGLVSDDFVRNTSPDWLTVEQAGLPLALRDSDVEVDPLPNLPDGRALILRTDRRLGFSPLEPWTLHILATRAHGSFQPEIGSVRLSLDYQAAPRFFEEAKLTKPRPQWLEAVIGRAAHIAILVPMLVFSVFALSRKEWLSQRKAFHSIRLVFLALVLLFIGWIGQGQLSIVTPLAVLHSALQGKSLAFLLYDPFSLLIWIVAILGLFFWGRALFCGWLCPFGAFQEWIAQIAKWLNIRQVKLPEKLDKNALLIKYILLFGLVVVALYRPEQIDKAAEVEPFKTAISVMFQREWFYVCYAVLALGLSLFSYKAFCRFFCPLGALMAIGGLLQGKAWIKRRAECGDPCQLCRVRCKYRAISKSGEIHYSECFGCLDCVRIYARDEECVPLILAAKRKAK